MWVIPAIGSGAADYLIEQSLLFNDNDSAYLNRTPSVAGNRKTWTFSTWVKRASLPSLDPILSVESGSDWFMLYFNSSHQLLLQQFATSTVALLQTNAVFRDTSAWYHIVVSIDTTNATAGDRMRMWVNGVEITSFATDTNPALNLDTFINATLEHRLGRWTTSYFDGLMALPILVDGAALDPTSFGELDDNGYWNPIEYTGSFGTNGFELDFANSANFGNDTSGGTSVAIIPQGLYTHSTDAPTRTTAWYDGITSQGSTTGTYKGSPGEIFFRIDLGAGNTRAAGGFKAWALTDDGFISGSDTYGLQQQGSNNGTDWTNVGAQVTGTDSAGAVVDNIDGAIQTISDTTEYRYHQVVLSNETNAANNIMGMAELQIYVASNDYNAHNFTAADQFNDVPTDDAENGTGNYPTFNPNDTPTATLSNGNLTVTYSGGDKKASVSTLPLPSTGLICIEGLWNTYAGDSGFGFITNTLMATSTWRTDANNLPGGAVNISGFVMRDGGNFYFSGGGATSYTTPSAGQYERYYVDMDTGKVYLEVNGTFVNSGDPGAGTGQVGTFSADQLADGIFVFASVRSGASLTVNYGATAFNTTPSDSYKEGWSTADFSAPTIADGSQQFTPVIYTGTGSELAITSLDFTPDFVWIKNRDATDNHMLYDSVRGATKDLHSNTTDAETTTAQTLKSFDSAGFTLGTDVQVNTNTEDYVAWCWKAGGAPASNTDGSITSSVSANTTSGFSIVSYTGTGVAATIGHGLGSTPKLIIVKNRDATQNWRVYTEALGATKYLNLNTTAAQDTDANQWNNTAPTASVFSVGTAAPTNGSTNGIIAYCWAEVEGFSKFGSYTGNGSVNGPFVYLGFRPAFILMKDATNAGYSWIIFDTKRGTYNQMTGNQLFPNLANAETGSQIIDVTSTGFKCRQSNGNGDNETSATHIFAAFAEHPTQGDDGYTQARAR